MRTLTSLLSLLVALVLTNCTAPAAATGTNNLDQAEVNTRPAKKERKEPGTSVEVNGAEMGVDLTSYLRKVPGVMVRGSGSNAAVRIRGDVSIQGNVSPLFVVNGTPLGTDFARVFDAVDVNDIQRVNVLKNVTDTNRYGQQGSAGVIEIRLKK